MRLFGFRPTLFFLGIACCTLTQSGCAGEFASGNSERTYLEREYQRVATHRQIAEVYRIIAGGLVVLGLVVAGVQNWPRRSDPPVLIEPSKWEDGPEEHVMLLSAIVNAILGGVIGFNYAGIGGALAFGLISAFWVLPILMIPWLLTSREFWVESGKIIAMLLTVGLIGWVIVYFWDKG